MAQPHTSPRHDREPSDPIVDAVDRLTAQLDILARDARLGRPHIREFERQADQARAILAASIALDALFRGTTVARPMNPAIRYHAGLGWGG